MHTEIRKWSKATNYPYGAYVFYTEDKEMKDIAMRWNDLGGIQTYLRSDGKGAKEMGWDLIFPRPKARKFDESLRRKLSACCEEGDE
jgi:hypothetical protein